MDQSKRVVINPVDNRIYIGKSQQPGPIANTFLYNLQQNNKKLEVFELNVIFNIKLPAHLTCNSAAKNFIQLSDKNKKNVLQSKPVESPGSLSITPPVQSTKKHKADVKDEEEFSTPKKWQKFDFDQE